jgi:septum site-determining protein MinC
MLDSIAKSTPAVTLRGSLFTLSVIQLNTLDQAAIERELNTLVRQAPKFFATAPVVIDLQAVAAEEQLPFTDLIQLLRQHGMIPVGVRGGNQQQHNAAKEVNLAVLSLAKRAEPTLATRQPNAPEQSKTEAHRDRTALLITKPVRSGQQYYAEGTDLIVVGAVSPGAELLADGNIHVYGPLRGRALAGVSGDQTVRIFCQSLEAEMISIAGRYVVNESLIKSKLNAPHQIYLAGETLKVLTLT